MGVSNKFPGAASVGDELREIATRSGVGYLWGIDFRFELENCVAHKKRIRISLMQLQVPTLSICECEFIGKVNNFSYYDVNIMWVEFGGFELCKFVIH